MDTDMQSGEHLTGAAGIQVASARPITLEFIDKVAEMSKFAFDFYKRESSMDAKLDSKEDLEKLFLINLHDTFSKLKADFTNAFKLLQNYLSNESEAPVLSTYNAAKVVSRLSNGANCVNMDQKMLGLRLMFSQLSK